jgi:hypothetical protein
MYFLYFFNISSITYYNILLLPSFVKLVLSNNGIFVLKFGVWRMSVFATDRRYSDNGILVSS